MLNSSKSKMLLALDTVMERKSGNKIKNDLPRLIGGVFFTQYVSPYITSQAFCDVI